MKVTGPQWDGKEEPRLLETVTAENLRPQKLVEALSSYAWMDATGHVKIYVDFVEADQVEDEQIALVQFSFLWFLVFFTDDCDWLQETEGESMKLVISTPTRDFVLIIDSLHDTIDSATFKKKPTKFIVSLKKTLPVSWFQLKKTKSS